jgi:ketosteroid isomerase-like protein
VSEQDVEIVRAAVKAFNAPDLEALRELIDEQIEFKSAVVGGVEGATYRGRDGMERYVADLDEVFEDRHIEDERYLDAGDGRIVLLYRTVARGKGSGVPIDQPLGIAFTVRNDRIVRGEIHVDPSGALRAAGLEDEGAG